MLCKGRQLAAVAVLTYAAHMLYSAYTMHHNTVGHGVDVHQTYSSLKEALTPIPHCCCRCCCACSLRDFREYFAKSRSALLCYTFSSSASQQVPHSDRLVI
jgi:hypothetical protein